MKGGTITLSEIYEVDFNLWGIHASGETLFPIEDNSNRLAIFNNFFTPSSGKVTPNRVVGVDGLVNLI